MKNVAGAEGHKHTNITGDTHVYSITLPKSNGTESWGLLNHPKIAIPGDVGNGVWQGQTTGGASVKRGCIIPNCIIKTLAPDHRCYNCGFGVHNLCTQSNKLTGDDGELNIYCSIACKNVKPV